MTDVCGVTDARGVSNEGEVELGGSAIFDLQSSTSPVVPE